MIIQTQPHHHHHHHHQYHTESNMVGIQQQQPELQHPTLANSQTMEISRMLNKLRTLVPGIPPEQKMSKLEIMQHVIDYISELETVLEDEDTVPSSSTMTNSNTNVTTSSPMSATSPNNGHHQTELVN